MWEEGVIEWYESMVQPLDLMGRMCLSCIYVNCICVHYACVICVCYVCMVVVMVAVCRHVNVDGVVVGCGGHECMLVMHCYAHKCLYVFFIH